MTVFICILEICWRATKSGRGLPQSRTLARWRCATKFAERLGLRALVVTFSLFVANAYSATNDFFTQGMALNQAGQFPEAAAAFQSDLKHQVSPGALVNLGIAEWQGGHAGAAMLAWERAAWLDPYDERAKQNLKFARQVTQVDAPELRWHEKISAVLPSAAWGWLAGVGLWLATGALVLPRVFRWRKSGGPQALAALGVGIFILALTAEFGVAGRTNLGVVLKKNAPLLLTPTRAGEMILTLNAGESARVLRARGNFYFIRTLMGAGWVARENIGFVVEK